MPTVLRIDAYRFFFYSADGTEPPHIHVERDANTAKFWLDPVVLARSGGFRRGEIAKLTEMVVRHRVELMEAWHEYFGR